MTMNILTNFWTWWCDDIGEVVGALSFPVGHGTNTLKKVSSSRMLHHPYDAQNIVSYSLRRKVWIHIIYTCLFQ